MASIVKKAIMNEGGKLKKKRKQRKQKKMYTNERDEVKETE